MKLSKILGSFTKIQTQLKEFIKVNTTQNAAMSKALTLSKLELVQAEITLETLDKLVGTK